MLNAITAINPITTQTEIVVKPSADKPRIFPINKSFDEHDESKTSISRFDFSSTTLRTNICPVDKHKIIKRITKI